MRRRLQAATQTPRQQRDPTSDGGRRHKTRGRSQNPRRDDHNRQTGRAATRRPTLRRDRRPTESPPTTRRRDATTTPTQRRGANETSLPGQEPPTQGSTPTRRRRQTATPTPRQQGDTTTTTHHGRCYTTRTPRQRHPRHNHHAKRCTPPHIVSHTHPHNNYHTQGHSTTTPPNTYALTHRQRRAEPGGGEAHSQRRGSPAPKGYATIDHKLYQTPPRRDTTSTNDDDKRNRHVLPTTHERRDERLHSYYAMDHTNTQDNHRTTTHNTDHPQTHAATTTTRPRHPPRRPLTATERHGQAIYSGGPRRDAWTTSRSTM